MQGVFFRAHTQQEAQRLGLTGWARNLYDGRVEVLACGEAGPLAQLRQWLKQGPRMARVDSQECENVDAAQAPDDFTTA